MIKWFQFKKLLLMIVLIAAQGVCVANSLPARLTPNVIKEIIHKNMSIFKSHGVLVIPLYYRFSWTGHNENEGWTFKGYRYKEANMMGINYEGSKFLKNWNGRLLPASETVIVNPLRFKSYMQVAFKLNWMKESNYPEVDYKADAYLCIRIKPRAHRLRRPY